MEWCEACINCDKDWSAGMDLSCHDCCEEFKKWEEERQDCQKKS